jgi:hypothetical protein
LADFLSSFYFALFIARTLFPLAYKKQTLPLVGWSKKYLSVKYFLTPTNAVTENPQAAENITNPTGWDGVKKYYSRQLRLSSSRDGVSWGMVNDTCLQYSLSLLFD